MSSDTVRPNKSTVRHGKSGLSGELAAGPVQHTYTYMHLTFLIYLYDNKAGGSYLVLSQGDPSALGFWCCCCPVRCLLMCGPSQSAAAARTSGKTAGSEAYISIFLNPKHFFFLQ